MFFSRLLFLRVVFLAVDLFADPVFDVKSENTSQYLHRYNFETTKFHPSMVYDSIHPNINFNHISCLIRQCCEQQSVIHHVMLIMKHGNSACDSMIVITLSCSIGYHNKVNIWRDWIMK